MKKPKIIKLKIISCSSYGKCWYKNKIGKYYYFFDKTFKDDEDNLSLWLAKPPTTKNRYVYFKDINYEIIIRKKKLQKINEKKVNL